MAGRENDDIEGENIVAYHGWHRAAGKIGKRPRRITHRGERTS